MSVLLGVNIDHIATVRNARGGTSPDPVEAAIIAERHGADGITAHLREDRRHIRDEDMKRLARRIQTRLNFEMAVTDEMVEIATAVGPAHACLVPEKREELTTEGGLDVVGQFDRVKNATVELKNHQIEVSLFIDPVEAQIQAAFETGAQAIELHTGGYAEGRESIAELTAAVAFARDLGLIVNAGHGLDYRNVQAVAAIEGINELNIGFSIISEALFAGLGQAVARMRKLIDDA